ncbi:MAG: NAD(P)-binding domain-containing protein [Corynebacterium sp.]|nr:NAD(P)-binding domain-containing protein [Corynebacterium sp.]
MKIAFLGTGRMGTELAKHLLADHELNVWNRNSDKTTPLVDAGATAFPTAAEAVADADVVITALFGPDTVREVVLAPQLIPTGVPWLDTTTVSPKDAEEFAAQVPTYIGCPVVGTLGPARNGTLGVYVGNPDAGLRELAAGIVAPWADPQRLKLVDTQAKAAIGKLLANLALAISAEGLKEALLFGDATGLSAQETLDMLDFTGLAFIKNMKQDFVLGVRDTDPGDFTVDALCKDSKLMVDTAGPVLPAIEAVVESFTVQQNNGRGNQDFSAILVNRDER